MLIDNVDYEAIRERMRRKHKIRETAKLWIRQEGQERAKDQRKIKKYLVQVVYIGKFFITLEFPAGYRRSFYWDEFEEVRMD